MFNKKILSDVIAAYINDFEQGWWQAEEFKWNAVKEFQDNWDIDAADFKEMLVRSLSATKNLLTAKNYFPFGMLQDFATTSPEELRAMFKKLFDENKDLNDRIEEFKNKSTELKAFHPNANNHFQNENSITTYLWLRYPEKYYIYKYSEVKSVAQTLNSDLVFKGGDYANNIDKFMSLYDEINDEIKKNKSLCDILDDKLKAIGCSDVEYHTLTIDIGFYIARKYKKPVTDKKYWVYAPGVNAEKWDECVDKGIMMIGWGEIGNLEFFADRDDMAQKMKREFKKNTSYTNDSLATWEFANEIQPGDVIFAKNGTQEIVGQGVVTGDYEFDAKRNDAYRNYRAVRWEHNAKKAISKQVAQKTLTDITKDTKLVDFLLNLYNQEDEKNYWFVNAKPSIWSFENINIGESIGYDLYNDKGHKRRVFQNFLDAKEGDLVIGYESTPAKQIVALCRVAKASDGEKLYMEKTENLLFPIDYDEFKNIDELANMEYLVSPQGSLFKLTENEYDILMDIIRENNPITPTDNQAKKYTKKDFLSQVFIDSNQYDHIVSTLKRKKNIVFQGAPGVGKTYAAKRLAYSMMNEKDDNRIEFVQFHQNYSYEDFVLGYKPSGNEFKLKSGVFFNFCKKASNDMEHDYFFIIDEINRGNMSKIFGELLMLIEADYRDQVMTLAYDNKKLSVPHNLYIIGMMNTADRSIAMIDYALRRRFGFVTMEPQFDSEGFKTYQKDLQNTRFDELIKKIKDLNEYIKDDSSLGKGFCIGHSYFCNLKKEDCNDELLKEIVEFDIIPMLEEYWFDDEDTVIKWADELRGVFR